MAGNNLTNKALKSITSQAEKGEEWRMFLIKWPSIGKQNNDISIHVYWYSKLINWWEKKNIQVIPEYCQQYNKQTVQNTPS